MTLVVIIRPEPGASSTLAAARARGLDAVAFPLFVTESVDWLVPEPETIDALLLGSANALLHGGAGLCRYRGKPAYAVGSATAEAAKAAGLTVAATGGFGLQELLEHIDPRHHRLLRLCGRSRVQVSSPADVTVIERVVYDSAARPMPTELARLLGTHALAQAVVLLHSAQAARHFARECDRVRVPRARLRLAALGPRIAEAAGNGWASLSSAAQPEDATLLALAGQLCKSSEVPKPER